MYFIFTTLLLKMFRAIIQGLNFKIEQGGKIPTSCVLHLKEVVAFEEAATQ